MILTPHFLFGAAIGANIGSWPTALGLALLSHYALDAVPHWDYNLAGLKNKRWFGSMIELAILGLDLLTGTLLVLFLAQNKLISLAAGFAAVSPDILSFFFILKPGNPVLKLHYWFHAEKMHWFNGKSKFGKRLKLRVLTQVFIVVASLAAL